MSLILATAFLGTMTYGAMLPVSLNIHETYAQSADDTLEIPADPAPPLAAADRRFVTAATLDNLAAIDALNLLAERGSDETLRRFAWQTLDGRKALQQALEVLAIQKDLTLPQHAAVTARAALASLEPLSGEAFDRAWMRRYSALSLRTAARFGPAQQRQLQNDDIRAFAAAQSDIQRQHAENARRAAADDADCACVVVESASAEGGGSVGLPH